MKSAIELVQEERLRQISKEGYDHEHDDKHDGCELAIAAACYACHPMNIYWINDQLKNKTVIEKLIPFDQYEIDTKHSDIRKLVIAGALIVAEIERLQRENKIENKD